MTSAFQHYKKTFLAKQDKSKKGSVDEQVLPLITAINSFPDYYTTSSCSGRAYLWKGSGKKNQTEWLRVSHGFINENFLKPPPWENELIWLRVEPLILHVACRDLTSANLLLNVSRRIYKKSCILSASNKILVEIRGSEFLETPLHADDKALCTDFALLVKLVNDKMKKIEEGRKNFITALQAFSSAPSLSAAARQEPPARLQPLIKERTAGFPAKRL